MNVVHPVELEYKTGENVRLEWKMNMAIVNEEEDLLEVVSHSAKNATWDLVPIKPVSYKMT